MPFEKRIDTHAHFVPPFYRTACEETGNGRPDGMPAIPPWSEQEHLTLMTDLNITKSILSISSPGTYLKPEDPEFCRKLTRRCNDFANEIVQRRPDEFGFWAVLPLPDVQGALEEIGYAADNLCAEGFALETNHHGLYLGTPAFDAVFDQLNRRGATVFIHPTTPCMRNIGSDSHNSVTVLPQYPNPMFEFMFDTVRAVANLFLSGTVARCPKITFVIPHAGGALPPILQRICSFNNDILHSEIDISSKVVRETFQRQFYFDMAGFPFPDQINGLLRLVKPERLLYGSDFPFTPAEGVASLAESMKVGLEDIFPDEAVRSSIYSTNAKRLLGHPK